MTTEQYDQAVATAIDNAVVELGYIPSPTRAEHVLTTLATIVARLSRDFHLLNLTTAAELAEKWHVTPRAVQQLAQRRHARFGVGMLIGGMWVFAIDEIPLLEQDMRRQI